MSTPSGLLLLDTNIVIFLVRGGPIGEALDTRFGLRQRPERPLISVVTQSKAVSFARQNGWGAARADGLRALLRQFVVVDISSQPVLDRYADIDAFLRRTGRALSDNDVWIAACASAAQATLITTDRDFDPLADQYLDRIWVDPRNPTV